MNSNSAILSFEAVTLNGPQMPQIVEDPRWQAVLARDGASDGKFVFAVSSTGASARERDIFLHATGS